MSNKAYNQSPQDQTSTPDFQVIKNLRQSAMNCAAHILVWGDDE